MHEPKDTYTFALVIGGILLALPFGLGVNFLADWLDEGKKMPRAFIAPLLLSAVLGGILLLTHFLGWPLENF